MGERILVTGASGYLGWELATELVRRGYEVLGTSRDGSGVPGGVRPNALQLTDPGAVQRLVSELRPHAVFHTAALSAVGDCARDPGRACRVNAEASGELARAVADVGGWLLYTSTDLVFDGTRAPYGEADDRSPLGPYMWSKAKGEDRVLAASPDFLVARVALLYGRGGGRRRGGFYDQVVMQLRHGRPVGLFTDEHRTPLELRDAVSLLANLLQARPGGTLHLAGPDRISRHEHGVAAARTLGFDPALCVPITQDDRPDLGPRPQDVSLRIDRLRDLVGWEPAGVEAGCARLRT
jgi:dTDP-4-dehydrorhamnose reductase